MNSAQIAAQLAKIAKQHGPKAADVAKGALVATATKVISNSQVQAQSGTLLEQGVARLRGSDRARIEAQLDLATNTATEELQEQTLVDRQDQCRTWIRALKVQRVALKATENQDRKTAKQRRAEVRLATDAILTEILETISKWSEAP
jgi:hypothetical protein